MCTWVARVVARLPVLKILVGSMVVVMVLPSARVVVAVVLLMFVDRLWLPMLR